MRYLALAADYDGTIAADGKTSKATASAINRLRTSGRRAILVTGRRLEDLLAVCPHLDLFDYVVAENGALVYSPATREETLLGKRPPASFIERLRSLGVYPLEVGRVIVATWLPHHTAVLQAIQETGLELLIVFNKNAVMILPTGVNKATGLDYALRKLGLSFHEAVGIGDAENDHSFLARCECSVAVSNAVPSIRETTACVTRGANGAGVTELIDEIVANDLFRLQDCLPQHLIAIGMGEDGTPVTVPPYGVNILIIGPSGSGKSTITAGIAERLMEQAYQVCIVDPEGDYGSPQGVITLGDRQHAVGVGEVLGILEDPKINLNVNLLGIPLSDRPEFLGQLFPSLRTLRIRTGRPHWLILDEAHHMLPREWGHLSDVLPQSFGETVFVTVHANHLPSAVLSRIDVVMAVGPSPEKTLEEFSSASGHALSWPAGLLHSDGKAIVWFVRENKAPFAAAIMHARGDRIRHRRKYAEGDMRHRSFYFRGPGDRHNIKAHNLAIFSQIAEGIHEDTWMYHLHRGDYSKWFRDSVKDAYLADQMERIERRDLAPAETRRLVRDLIESRYTLPE